jgi:transcriptional regulator with XRE-family HTH domain
MAVLLAWYGASVAAGAMRRNYLPGNRRGLPARRSSVKLLVTRIPGGTVSETMERPQKSEFFADFPSALRYWRAKRGHSQLQLSMIGAVSQRHISFLESGSSQPSKELILKLCVVLDIPLRQRNVMLLAAGFAPAYRERKLSDPELDAVRYALEFMLRQQAPFPALVVDRLWNLQMLNLSAAGLFRWLLDMPADQHVPVDGALNALRMMLDPNGLRPYIVNWDEVALDSLHWIEREAMSDGPGSEASSLLRELSALAGNAGRPWDHIERNGLPFLPITLRKNGVELTLFTAIATLGTPRDVTLHELRIESFFPANSATEDWFKARFG